MTRLEPKESWHPKIVDHPSPRPHVSVRDLRKVYGETALYDDFSVDFIKGHVTTIFGPNGCGKSTLIGMMSGIIGIDGGTILYEGRTINDTRIGYVFQNYRDVLFPWLSALDNIRYPLTFMGIPILKQREMVDRIVAQTRVQIDLSKYLINYPADSSRRFRS